MVDNCESILTLEWEGFCGGWCGGELVARKCK